MCLKTCSRYLCLAGQLDVVDVVEGLLHALSQRQHAMVPQHQHLTAGRTSIQTSKIRQPPHLDPLPPTLPASEERGR